MKSSRTIFTVACTLGLSLITCYLAGEIAFGQLGGLEGLDPNEILGELLGGPENQSEVQSSEKLEIEANTSIPLTNTTADLSPVHESKFIASYNREAGNNTAGQNTTAFEYPPYGISLEIPSNWRGSTAGLDSYRDLIAFYSPPENISDISPVRLKISVLSYLKNITLPAFTNFSLSTVNQSDLRSSEQVSIAGYPGQMVVLVDKPLPDSPLTFLTLYMWTTVGNRVYQLQIDGEESNYNRYLPQLMQIVDSLKISR